MHWAPSVYYSIAVAFPDFKAVLAREGNPLKMRLTPMLIDWYEESLNLIFVVPVYPA